MPGCRQLSNQSNRHKRCSKEKTRTEARIVLSISSPALSWNEESKSGLNVRGIDQASDQSLRNWLFYNIFSADSFDRIVTSILIIIFLSFIVKLWCFFIQNESSNTLFKCITKTYLGSWNHKAFTGKEGLHKALLHQRYFSDWPTRIQLRILCRLEF